MEEILKTTLLEFEKSSFIIDIVKHTTEKKYVSITQIIRSNLNAPVEQRIKINPDLLPTLIKTLDSHYRDITGIVPVKKVYEPSSTKRPKDKHSEIQRRYLKGITIAELMLQFDCKEEYIRQVLRNHNIALPEDVVAEKPFKPKWRKRKYK